ncbi:hypothetical protein T484DRAFT_1822784 [Baffinella frigidus]|nr:hypothetical protein T484DRAFT_1822784 [Cryptophyta sp. CCMP2293]
MANRRLAAVVLVGVLACTSLPLFASAGSVTGAPECPCLPESSPKFAAARAIFVRLGYAAGYGEQGCQAYDENNALDANCVKTEPSQYCTKKWCYVDTDLCPEDADKCTAAGSTNV